MRGLLVLPIITVLVAPIFAEEGSGVTTPVDEPKKIENKLELEDVGTSEEQEIATAVSRGQVSSQSQTRQGKGNGYGPLGAGKANKIQVEGDSRQSKFGSSAPSGNRNKPQKSGQ